jgi:hypothetical protein
MLFGTEYLEMHYVPVLPHRNSVCIPDGHGMRLEAWLEVCSGMESCVLLPRASHVYLQGQSIEEYQYSKMAHILKNWKLVKMTAKTKDRPPSIMNS